MINKLVEKIKKTGAPIVVGLDPMLSYIPQHILDKAYAEYGETLEGAAEAVWQFNKEIVDKTYDLIPAVKPQIAMYEQLGIPGLEALRRQWITASQRSGYYRRCKKRRYRVNFRSICDRTSWKDKSRK